MKGTVGPRQTHTSAPGLINPSFAQHSALLESSLGLAFSGVLPMYLSSAQGIHSDYDKPTLTMRGKGHTDKGFYSI